MLRVLCCKSGHQFPLTCKKFVLLMCVLGWHSIYSRWGYLRLGLQNESQRLRKISCSRTLRPAHYSNLGSMLAKRLFIAVLILSVIGYGTAWAFDTHALDLSDHAQLSFDAGFSPLDHDDSDCDHCCHANAHFTGLASSGFRAFPSTSTSNDATALAVYLTRSPSPPFKPPQT